MNNTERQIKTIKIMVLLEKAEAIDREIFYEQIKDLMIEIQP